MRETKIAFMISAIIYHIHISIFVFLASVLATFFRTFSINHGKSYIENEI